MDVIEKAEKYAKHFINDRGETRAIVLEITPSEHKVLLRLAKLGARVEKLNRFPPNHSNIVDDSWCSGYNACIDDLRC